jgi:hypothetical protein
MNTLAFTRVKLAVVGFASLAFAAGGAGLRGRQLVPLSMAFWLGEERPPRKLRFWRRGGLPSGDHNSTLAGFL